MFIIEVFTAKGIEKRGYYCTKSQIAKTPYYLRDLKVSSNTTPEKRVRYFFVDEYEIVQLVQIRHFILKYI